MKKVLLGLGSVVAGLVFTGCVASTEPSYGYYGYNDYPTTTTYVAPAPASVYIEGDWYLDGGHWRRHPGHWSRGPYHHSYNRGYYGSPRSNWR